MDLKLTNDLELENGDLLLVQDASATAQRIRHRLLTFRGEWFLDLLFGPDYLKDILIKNSRLNVVTAIIKSEILKSVDSGSFSDFSTTLSDRNSSISYTLNLENETITEAITL